MKGKMAKIIASIVAIAYLVVKAIDSIFSDEHEEHNEIE